MSIGQETGRRPGGRLRMDAAQFMMAAALGIMFLALLLAAAAVQGATLPAQRPDAPSTSGSAGPALILRDGDGALTALAPEAAELTAHVDALAARVTVEHRFRAGPGPSRSGVYILPLPDDAEPRRVRVAVGDRNVEIGLAVERGEPRPELLALPISGIGPHAVVSIELIYERAVALGGGRFVLALPVPQGASDAPQVSLAAWSGAGTALRLELDPGLPIAELRSPSHGIDIQRGPGERRSILLADPEPAAGRDFILVWKPADPTASVAALRRFTAAERNAEPRPEEALLLRARPIGNSAALAPAVAQSALLAGSPIDDGAILTAIAARSGTGLAGSSSDISPALAGSILAVWALGAFYLATRRGARSPTSFNPSTGPLQ
jgi:hypothetical protein